MPSEPQQQQTGNHQWRTESRPSKRKGLASARPEGGTEFRVWLTNGKWLIVHADTLQEAEQTAARKYRRRVVAVRLVAKARQ